MVQRKCAEDLNGDWDGPPQNNVQGMRSKCPLNPLAPDDGCAQKHTKLRKQLAADLQDLSEDSRFHPECCNGLQKDKGCGSASTLCSLCGDSPATHAGVA